MDPFERLRRSHRRLEQVLGDLGDLMTALQAGVPLDDVRGGIGDVLGFLGHQVARHEADEETSLFPRLSDLPSLAALVEKLAREHETQRALAAELTAALASGQVGTLIGVARALRTSYEGHVAREEGELFPAVVEALPPDVLAAMATEMDRRRGGRG